MKTEEEEEDKKSVAQVEVHSVRVKKFFKYMSQMKLYMGQLGYIHFLLKFNLTASNRLEDDR